MIRSYARDPEMNICIRFLYLPINGSMVLLAATDRQFQVGDVAVEPESVSSILENNFVAKSKKEK
jgi:hypothetical protein